MTWAIVCAVLGVLLGLATLAFMNSALQGVGSGQSFLVALREGWYLWVGASLFWFGVCAAVYWSWVGLHALLHLWSGS